MPLFHCYRNLETTLVHWCRLWLQKFYWVPEIERVGKMEGFWRTKHCIGMCTLYSIVCVQKTLSVQRSATHGASILLPFLRLEDRWWRGDGRMLRATACGGPERKYLQDMSWWLPELMVSRQLWLPEREPHKIKTVNIPEWRKEGLVSSHP